MTAERMRQPARRRAADVQQRADVGDEAVVSRHQLVQLAAGREVLILEARRLARHRRAEHLGHDLVVDRGEHVARAGKEAAHRRESVRDRVGARGAASVVSMRPVRRSMRVRLRRPRRARPRADRTGAASRSGISVCTASTMSRSRVSAPRFGATPVRIHAGRFWYMSPRVPSIGSTSSRHRQSAPRAPAAALGPPPAVPRRRARAARRARLPRGHRRASASLTRSTA